MAPRAPWTDAHPMDRQVLAWHGMARLTDRRVIARTPREVRSVVRILKRLSRRLGLELLAFSVVDTHVHALLAGERLRVGEVFRRFEIATGKALSLGVGFSRCFIKPVHTHGYLQNCFRYILGQHEHHATFGDPFLEGSCVHELNGFRVGRVRSVAARYLPRFGSEDCAEVVGLSVEEIRSWDAPLGLGELGELVEAGVAALELKADGTSVPRGHGRTAVILAVDPTVRGLEVAQAVGCHERTVRRCRAHGMADPVLVTAVRRQLRFRRSRPHHWGAFAPGIKAP